jgi:hypothetical protein
MSRCAALLISAHIFAATSSGQRPKNKARWTSWAEQFSLHFAAEMSSPAHRSALPALPSLLMLLAMPALRGSFSSGLDPPPQMHAGISDAGVAMADADETSSMKLTLRLSREDGLRLRELAAAARYPVKPSTVARALLEQALQNTEQAAA